MNHSFWQDIAKCKELQGNDLRVVMLCYNRDLMQKEIIQELGWKKTNVSTIVNKLVSLDILEKEHQAGSYFYRANNNWNGKPVNEVMP